MHYEDLVITELNWNEYGWFAKLTSLNGGSFEFPIASDNITQEELEQHGVFVGKNFLGAIQNDKLVALDGFSFIESKSKIK